MIRIGFVLIGIYCCCLLNGQVGKSNEIWNQGIGLMKQYDYLQGMEKMNQFLSLLPNNPYALYNRGLCRQKLGDLDGSCQDFSNAVAYDEKYFRKIIPQICDTQSWHKILMDKFYEDLELSADRGYRPKYTRADTLRGALRPERTCFDVYFYNLTVRIHPVGRSIEGKNEIWFKGLNNSDEIQLDLFPQYIIKSIMLDTVHLKYRREYNALFIEIPGSVQPGLSYKVVVEYAGIPDEAPDPPWRGGFVWSRDKRMHRWISVACEQLGASSWWPTKDHLTDKPDSMAINIEVPKRYQAMSNGLLRRKVEVDKKYNRYEWFVHYPINNYNVTFYMGKYAEYTDTLIWSDDTLTLRYDVLPYHLKIAKEHFKQCNDVVAFYCDVFGAFPFWKDNYRLVESPFEGMEHQTAIAYGENFDNTDEIYSYRNKMYDYIIVHESAHEWWGNSVTAVDMADVWIHEGFSTYAEYLFIEHKLGYDESIAELHNHMKYIYNVWQLVQNRDVNENAFAGSEVYFKGSTLLQCLRATMDNDSLFMLILKDFQLQYKYKVVNTNDFINFVNKYTDHNYSPLFNIFLYKTSIPVLEYKYERSDTNLVLQFKWTGVEDGFEMPFSIEEFDKKSTYRIMATTTEQTFTIKNATSFSFFNMFKSTEGCPHNGLTYFWTKCMNEL